MKKGETKTEKNRLIIIQIYILKAGCAEAFTYNTLAHTVVHVRSYFIKKNSEDIRYSVFLCFVTTTLLNILPMALYVSIYEDK